ncbi:MAG: ABC transporter permease subunit [Spirochaetota bacterium]|nr:ABC transporter permease subunit [Spirochaetota bacterium]
MNRFKKSFIIMNKELASFFTTPVAYIVITIFLVITGWFFFSTFFLYGQAELRAFFQLLPIIFSFVIPAITMRLFSEEENSGSLEILMTLPLKTFDVVVGKFLASTVFIIIMLIPTLVYAFSISFVGSLDYGPVLGGYFGAVLLGGAYSAVGLFASSITKNQIVAFMIALVICLMLTLLDKFLFFLPASILGFVEYLGADFHFRNISRGIIDSRDLIYFLSVMIIGILVTIQILEERR